jgi:hypothetical protein
VALGRVEDRQQARPAGTVSSPATVDLAIDDDRVGARGPDGR